MICNPDAQQLEAADSLKRAQPAALLNWDPSVGTPSQVSAASLGVQTLSGVKGARSKAVNQGTYAQRAIAVMQNLAPLFRIKDAGADLKASKAEDTDKLGFRHQRLSQVYRGIPVVGGDMVVHFDSSGVPYRVDGRYVPDVSLDIDPAVTEQAAVEAAKNDFAARGFSSPAVRVLEQPKLVVYALGASPALAYQLELQDTPVNAWRYWVDAVTGIILAAESRVCQIAPPTSTGGTAVPLSGNVLPGEGGSVKTFSGWSQNSVYYMYSPTNFYFVYNNAGGTGSAPPAPTITADRISAADISAAAAYPDADTYAYRNTVSWGTSDPVEVSIAVNMQASFGYYKSVHGRNGFDGTGKVVAAIAHYDSNLVNAYWTGAEMVFGDGDGVTANSLAVADVCAHELTHGVTETTANLTYRDESGALNESFSDIFGALVEFYAQPDGRASYPKAAAGTGDWLCGEDCWLEGTALRDFRNPSSTVTLAAGYQQPSKYKGKHWHDYTTDPWDNGGVHINSGVQNFFFYLLCEGGKGTNGGISYDFAGIGIPSAEQVAYRTLTTYCTPKTDFKQVQNAWVTAAQDLNASWGPAVKAAWRAVGIGITSPLLVAGRAGFPITAYRITATDIPTSYSASGLPAGLSLSGNTISGTPTVVGEFDATISATTGGVTFSDTLHFSILDPTVPVVSIVSPSGGGKFPPGLPFPVRVIASDLGASLQPGTITRVDLYADGVLVGTDTTEPYEFFHTASTLGSCALQAKATDTDGKTGASSVVTVLIAYLSPGDVDPFFTPPVADDVVSALAADPDRRIYLGGLFTKLGGTDAPRVGRLNADGSVDRNFFAATGEYAQVRALLHVPQDKGLYVGGSFANSAGTTSRRAMVRLRTGQSGFVDGSIDPSFAPVFAGASSSATPSVRAIARQYDGKVLVGGSFSSVNGVSSPNIARLNADGTVDTTFVAPAPSGAVNALALQPDGKILVGGAFTQVAGQSRRGVARLNLDGTLDTDFIVGTGVSGTVNSIAVAPDGSVYAGGQFGSYNGRTVYNNLVKLSSGGVLEGRFNYSIDSTGGLNGAVNSVQVRPTGEVLVCGLFTQISNSVLPVAPTAVGRIVQLKPDGSIDPDFNPGGTGANNTVHSASTLANGNLVLVGAFSTFNGVAVSRISLISGTDGLVPLITSGQFRTISAGGDLDLKFTSSSVPGPVEFQLISGALPRGVTFDAATGRLSGIPLDSGSFSLEIRPRQIPGGPEGQPATFVLHVLPEVVNYQTWRRAWFSGGDLTNDSVSGPSAPAPKIPGLSNLAVYAMSGGNPWDPASTQVPSIGQEWSGGKRYWTYSVPKYRHASAAYTPMISTNLVDWAAENTASPQLSQLLTLENSSDTLRVRSTVPIPQADRQFFRLRVTSL